MWVDGFSAHSPPSGRQRKDAEPPRSHFPPSACLPSSQQLQALSSGFTSVVSCLIDDLPSEPTDALRSLGIGLIIQCCRKYSQHPDFIAICLRKPSDRLALQNVMLKV